MGWPRTTGSPLLRWDRPGRLRMSPGILSTAFPTRTSAILLYCKQPGVNGECDQFHGQFLGSRQAWRRLRISIRQRLKLYPKKMVPGAVSPKPYYIRARQGSACVACPRSRRSCKRVGPPRAVLAMSAGHILSRLNSEPSGNPSFMATRHLRTQAATDIIRVKQGGC